MKIRGETRKGVSATIIYGLPSPPLDGGPYRSVVHPSTANYMVAVREFKLSSTSIVALRPE